MEKYGSGSTVHRTFQKWLAVGFFEKIRAKGLEQYDELKGIGWEWQSLDGCMIKAPLAVVLSGANTYDVKLLEETPDRIVVLCPEPDEEHPQGLCLDAGYTGSQKKVQDHGYTPYIRPRGREKREPERNPNLRARRWVVEVTRSFFNRFRKLLVRFEKKSAYYLALIQFACAVIVWRKLIPRSPLISG